MTTKKNYREAKGSKATSILTVSVTLGKNVYYVEESKTENGPLVDVLPIKVISVNFADNDPNAGVIVINGKYNVPVENRPGRREYREIITDEKEAIETALYYATKHLEEATEAEEEAKKRVKICSQLVNHFENMTSLENPNEEVLGNTVIIDTHEEENSKHDDD